MKVGIIGLGRMGLGMSRRMIRDGIEVWGYRRNYEKAQEAYENGHVDGVTVDIKTLVQTVKSDGPGIFMMVVPAETVEDTLNELLLDCSEGDIIIDHGNSNFKDSPGEQKGWKSWASNILTVVLVVVFMVLSVDIVLWLGVQILQYPLQVQSLEHSHLALPLLPHRPSHKSPLVLSMGGYIVDHQVQVIL